LKITREEFFLSLI